MNRFKVKVSEVVISATHTHSAPNVSWEEFGEIDDEYRSMLIENIKKSLDILSSKFIKAVTTYSRKKIEGDCFVYRRKLGRDIKSFFIKKKLLMLPNSNVTIDDECRNISYISKGKKISLINASCHPVFSNSKSSSSDYPGEVLSILDNDVDKTFFIQGWCGDIRPNVTQKNSNLNLLNYIKGLFNVDVFGSPDRNNFNYFCSRLTEAAKVKGLDNAYGNSILTSYNKLKIFSQCGLSTKDLRIIACRYGNTIFISINAEVSTKYYLDLKSKFNNFCIVPIGYSNGMIGYLPYPTDIKEGGYEVNSYANYGWKSPISAPYLNKVIVKLNEIIHDIILNRD